MNWVSYRCEYLSHGTFYNPSLFTTHSQTPTAVPKVRAMVIDFGDVLCSWVIPSNSVLPSPTLKSMMSSKPWYDYERGFCDRDVCFALLAAEFNVDVEAISTAMDDIRQSLSVHQHMLALIQQIKQCHPHIRIYGMTNTPKEERDVLIAITSRSSIFDGVYISGELGMRKPELDFYQYVLRDIDLAAEQVVLIDDKCRNVRAAEACGMHGVVFHDYDALRRDLEVLLG
ncbi:hypothetical protein AnigIFM49718_001841 [Aspergillus niger]|nr:hypothetical protein AnigIFM49718_001841 [Aspergillus niger]